MQISLTTMVILPLLAVVAPLLARLTGRWLPIPLVVFEIGLGLLIGPALLGWVQPHLFVSLLADLGLAMLFFLAGHEIDFRHLAGRPLRRASLGWMVSLIAGVGAGLALAGPSAAAGFIGIALTSTALGTIMPMLRDAGELTTPFGRAVSAVGAIGEFLPLIAISLFLTGHSPWHGLLVLIAFVLIAAAAVLLARHGSVRALHPVIDATLHTSGQFAVRLVLLVLLALVALSLFLELDMLLGAFAAGMLFQIVLSDAPPASARLVRAKIEGLGFGFLVPLFFIYTGVSFDLGGLVGDWRVLVMLPIFVLLLLIVRGVPSMLVAPPRSAAGTRIATGLFGATGLPIIVAVTAIGVDTEALTTGVAAALVGAGMLSVLIFPLIALAIRRPSMDAVASGLAQPAPEVASADVEHDLAPRDDQ